MEPSGTPAMAHYTGQLMEQSTGSQFHCLRARTGRMALRSIPGRRIVSTSRPGHEPRENTGTAAGYFSPRMAAGLGSTYSTKIDTFTMLRLIHGIPMYSMRQVLSRPPGDRPIAGCTGLAFRDSTSSGDIG